VRKQKQKQKKVSYDDYDDDLLYRIYLSKQYDKFKTGLTFTEVCNILYRRHKELRKGGEYMFITRHTVLGRWREMKLEMFSIYYDEPAVNRQEMLDFLNKVKK
jgi:hypothetical protein